jgi:hypothetical protein
MGITYHQAPSPSVSLCLSFLHMPYFIYFNFWAWLCSIKILLQRLYVIKGFGVTQSIQCLTTDCTTGGMSRSYNFYPLSSTHWIQPDSFTFYVIEPATGSYSLNAQQTLRCCRIYIPSTVMWDWTTQKFRKHWTFTQYIKRWNIHQKNHTVISVKMFRFQVRWLLWSQLVIIQLVSINRVSWRRLA